MCSEDVEDLGYFHEHFLILCNLQVIGLYAGYGSCCVLPCHNDRRNRAVKLDHVDGQISFHRFQQLNIWGKTYTKI